MTTPFLKLIGDRPLNTVFEKWHPIELDQSDELWLEAPPPEFMQWARDFPPASFNWQAPGNYLKQPTFLVSQAHRVWISSKLVRNHIKHGESWVDLGSFPFVVPLALRSFMKHEGPILATVIQPVAQKDAVILSSHDIATQPLDLDPYIRNPDEARTIPLHLDLEDGSQDVITMFHVIEHLYHPMCLLRESYRLLRPGGRLIVTTDNAMMLNVFVNYISNLGYTFEPVESTAAMRFDDWRGHVRFFTERDLRVLGESAGLRVIETGFREIFYNRFFSDYFENWKPTLPEWRANVLREHPAFANDIYVVFEKPAN